MDYCEKNTHLHGETRYPFLLVMNRAERDLSDLLSHDRAAGHDLLVVVDILRQVAECMLYLHVDCERIHGKVANMYLR